jgi:hypothetical protein
MQSRDYWIAAALIGFVLAPAGVEAGEPLNPPAMVTPIEGSKLSEVTLTPEAAARLGIQITEVRGMDIVRKRMVSGRVLETSSTGETAKEDPTLSPDAPEQITTAAGPSSAGGRLQVQVEPIGELDRTAGRRPARVVPITGALSGDGWVAEPSATPTLGAVEDASRPLSYDLILDAPGAVSPGRVLVELALSDGGKVHKVVPYASLLYDIKGDTWIYTSPRTLVFVRHPVQVNYIDNEWAVLTEGPPAGTAVVSVGVAELYGTEFKIGK